MLTLLALSALLSLQEPPAPPAPPPPPEPPRRIFVMGPEGYGSLDRDGDGQVTRDEFAAPMDDHFARLDKDRDGRLSSAELSDGQGPHRFEWRGSAADGDGGEREIIVLGRGDDDGPRILHMPHGEGPRGDARFEIRRHGGGGGHELDTDGDGKVSEAEFTAPLREAFARMDADRSGFVEDGERGGDGDGEVRVFTHRIETRREAED